MVNRSLIPVIVLVTVILSLPEIGFSQPPIISEVVTYKVGADTVSAYLSMPSGEGPFPALIVIHEWWGLNDWVKENTNEFAKRGYVALAIDLYRGHVATTSEEAHELMRGLPEDRAVKDLKRAFAFLKANQRIDSQRIGVIGWCMGGSYSLTAALNIQALAGSVICYGRLVTDDEELKKISCPVLGIFGETDRGIPAASVKAFERAAQNLDKNVRTTVYPEVGHGFMNPANKTGYHKETADNAWERIYAFLDSKVKSKGKK